MAQYGMSRTNPTPEMVGLRADFPSCFKGNGSTHRVHGPVSMVRQSALREIERRHPFTCGSPIQAFEQRAGLSLSCCTRRNTSVSRLSSRCGSLTKRFNAPGPIKCQARALGARAKNACVKRLMRTQIKATVVLLALLPSAQALAGDTGVHLKATLEARYAQLKTVIAARDSDAILGMLAPGFFSEDAEGVRETGPEMAQEIAALPKNNNKSSETTLLSTERQDDKVVVMQRYHMTSKKPKSDGSVQDIDLVTLSRDTWQLVNGQWLAVSTVTEQVDYKVDGALVGHKQHVGKK